MVQRKLQCTEHVQPYLHFDLSISRSFFFDIFIKLMLSFIKRLHHSFPNLIFIKFCKGNHYMKSK